MPAGYVCGIAVAGFWAVVMAQLCGSAGRFHGQVVGPAAMLGWSALALGPLCLLLGGLFAVLCKAAQGGTCEDRSAAVYSWEAVGAVAAGLVFHFLVAERLPAMAVAVLVAGVYATPRAAVVLRRRQWRNGLALSVVAGAAAAFVVLSMLTSDPMRSFRWPQANVVAETDSRYGNIAVVLRSGQMTFYESGLPAFTTEDTQANEVAVHPALLAHRHPRRVLMISGGLGGALTEVLKEPVERVDYVEMDRKLVELARECLPANLKRALDDPRVHIHLQDGRQYVRTCTDRYDVVLVLVPDPATTVIGRYYTREFYQEVRRILTPGGLVCTGLSAAQARLSGPRLELHASVYHALQSVFLAVSVIPGERTQYIAAAEGEGVSLDPGLLARRLRERRVRTTFVNDTWLRFEAGPLPRAMLLQSLDAARDAPPNRDAWPIAAHYWLRTWLGEVSPKAAGLLAAASRATGALWLLLPLSLAASLPFRRRPGLTRAAAGVSILGAGFLGMGAQLALAMAYQAVAGYLYQRIGLLMSLFMLGLALGAAAGRRVAVRWPIRVRAVLLGVGALQAASALALPALFACGHAGQLTVDAAFALASGWLGCLVGASFPLAVALSATPEMPAPRAAGRLYALDLLGAALGAVLVGAVAIPAAGMGQASHALAAVVLAALAPLLVTRGPSADAR
jgi:spermidine synthase